MGWDKRKVENGILRSTKILGIEEGTCQEVSRTATGISGQSMSLMPKEKLVLRRGAILQEVTEQRRRMG